MALKKFSIAVALFGILYSVTYCNSSVLSVVKPSPRAQPSNVESSRHFSDHSNQDQTEQGQHPAEVEEATKNIQRANHPSMGKVNEIASNATQQLKAPKSSRRSSAASGRQYGGGYGGGGGGSGWGWGYPSHYQKDNNADLYSLLAGLAFLATLLSALFGNQNQSSNVQVVNVSGRRRRRDVEDDVPGGLGLMQILKMVGVATSKPWWQEESDIDTKKVVPFSLV